MFIEDIISRGRERQRKQMHQRELLEELTEVEKRLDNVRTMYDMTTDGDLIDSLIYEEQCLKMRHKYLTIKAREDKVKIGTVIR